MDRSSKSPRRQTATRDPPNWGRPINDAPSIRSGSVLIEGTDSLRKCGWFEPRRPAKTDGSEAKSKAARSVLVEQANRLDSKYIITRYSSTRPIRGKFDSSERTDSFFFFLSSSSSTTTTAASLSTAIHKPFEGRGLASTRSCCASRSMMIDDWRGRLRYASGRGALRPLRCASIKSVFYGDGGFYIKPARRPDLVIDGTDEIRFPNKTVKSTRLARLTPTSSPRRSRKTSCSFPTAHENGSRSIGLQSIETPSSLERIPLEAMFSARPGSNPRVNFVPSIAPYPSLLHDDTMIDTSRKPFPHNHKKSTIGVVPCPTPKKRRSTVSTSNNQSTSSLTQLIAR